MFKVKINDQQEVHITEDHIRTLCGYGGIFDPNAKLWYVLVGKVTCPVCLAESERIRKNVNR